MQANLFILIENFKMKKKKIKE